MQPPLPNCRAADETCAKAFVRELDEMPRQISIKIIHARADAFRDEPFLSVTLELEEAAIRFLGDKIGPALSVVRILFQ